MMHRYPILIIHFLLILFIIVPGLSFAAANTDSKNSEDFRTCLTFGTAIVEDATKTAGAREKAIQSAIEAAAIQVCMELIPKHQLIIHFNALSRLTHIATQQYISDFKVLAEYLQGSSYQVLMETTLPISALMSEMKKNGIVMESTDNLSLLLLISESHVNDIAPQYWWKDVPAVGPAVAESTLSKAFAGNPNISVIAHDVLPTDGTELLYQFGPILNDKSALLLGELYAADLVAYGTATAQPTPNQIGALQSYTAELVINLIDSKTKKRIGTFSQTAASLSDTPATGGYEAIENATQKISKQVIAAIQSQNTHTTASPVSLILSGKSYMGAFLAIKRVLTQISGVRGIQPVEMQIDKAVLSIDYPYSAQKLAEELILHDFQSIGIHIQSIENRKILANCFKPADKTTVPNEAHRTPSSDTVTEAPLKP